ncbi:MAG TPA: nitroreductase family protein, partial [Candidatus Egerieicola pullicola]|nr:nitroreductase family protein [Candidatus Egerieicola pullicola]
MELMDYLTTRRSIRRYQDRLIPKETMEELIHIATLAPTGSGEQPWGFLVLDKKEEIDALSETIKAWLK